MKRTIFSLLCLLGVLVGAFCGIAETNTWLISAASPDISASEANRNQEDLKQYRLVLNNDSPFLTRRIILRSIWGSSMEASATCL